MELKCRYLDSYSTDMFNANGTCDRYRQNLYAESYGRILHKACDQIVGNIRHF